MILGQFWCPFWIDFVTFWRWGATVKTVLPPVRESCFHSLSGCKKVFGIVRFRYQLLVSLFVDFWRFWAPCDHPEAPYWHHGEHF